MSEPMIDYDLFYPTNKIGKYTIESEIKTSTRNKIYKVYIPPNQKEYFAIKILPYQTQEEINNYAKEKTILDQILDENIALFPIDNMTFTSSKQIINEEGEIIECNVTFMCIVMNFFDYLDLGNYFFELQNESQNKTPLTPEQIAVIFDKSLKILHHLHSKGIIHHDIKPGNFLIRSISPFDILLTDFELTFQLKESKDILMLCGTPKFIAPEILNEKPHNTSADIWSLGIMIYYLVMGKYPFRISEFDNDLMIILKKIEKNKDNLIFNINIPIEMQNILKRMLTFDPQERISANEALNHPFFIKYYNTEEKLKPIITKGTKLELEYSDAMKLENK